MCRHQKFEKNKNPSLNNNDNNDTWIGIVYLQYLQHDFPDTFLVLTCVIYKISFVNQFVFFNIGIN